MIGLFEVYIHVNAFRIVILNVLQEKKKKKLYK